MKLKKKKRKNTMKRKLKNKKLRYQRNLNKFTSIYYQLIFAIHVMKHPSTFQFFFLFKYIQFEMVIIFLKKIIKVVDKTIKEKKRIFDNCKIKHNVVDIKGSKC